jgi:phosphatidylglycerol:prolipoprotein diacylglycerol transferase
VVLFIVLWWYARKTRPRFAVSSFFLIGYGLARCFCEFFRQPDPQWDYLALGWLTMGQILSVPMIVVGIYGLIWSYSHHKIAQPIQ